jgi:hypothetical protein
MIDETSRRQGRRFSTEQKIEMYEGGNPASAARWKNKRSIQRHRWDPVKRPSLDQDHDTKVKRPQTRRQHVDAFANTPKSSSNGDMGTGSGGDLVLPLQKEVPTFPPHAASVDPWHVGRQMVTRLTARRMGEVLGS